MVGTAGDSPNSKDAAPPEEGDPWAELLAKIGDFGLAVAIDRSRLTTEGMMVGTLTLTLLPL